MRPSYGTHVEIGRLYRRVGASLRLAREAEGVTQRELATRLRVAIRTVQRWETAAVPLPLHILVAVADELDLSLDEMIPVEVEAERKSA